MPFGPVTFYVQALFFRVVGVSWTSMVLPACLFNTIAVLSVIRMIRLLSGGMRLLALCGGLATAVCFQAPFGTLWLEQTAMFFDLVALCAIVESFRSQGYGRILWQLWCGVSLILSALSKQNYGLLFVPIVFALLAAAELPDLRRTYRSVLVTGAGTLVASFVFLSWMWMFSDVPSFIHEVLVVAGEIGRSRATPRVIVNAFTFDEVPNLFQIDLIGFFAGVVALPLACSSLLIKGSDRRVWREIAPACALAIALPWYRSLTQAITSNDWQNNFAFVGLAVCLGVSLMFRIFDYVTLVPMPNCVTLKLPSAWSLKISLSVIVGMWGFVTLLYQVDGAWMRTIQEFDRRTRFDDTVHVLGMERVRWGDPTPIGATTPLRKADFENLTSYLITKSKPFFIMGDSSMLYGLLRTRSPQPLLYFLPSHSFLKEEVPRLDEIILAALERNRVTIVVREKATFLSAVHDAYPQFPRTWDWFESHFAHASDFGNYEVWEWKSGGEK